MITENRAVAALRFFLVVLFGILVVFQLLSLPGQFRQMAEQNPNDAPLRWPMTIIAGFLVLCVQVVVVATWQLLTLVKNDRIFSDASQTWVNAIAAAWLVVTGLFLWVGFQADDPGALLRRATALHSDMQAVI